MTGKKQQLLVDTTQRLMRREAFGNIRRMFMKTHPADLAAVLSYFEGEQRAFLFKQIEGQKIRAEVVAEMNHQRAADFLSTLPVEQVVELLKLMETDDAVDIIGSLPDELSKLVLSLMEPNATGEVGDLLKYDEDTAGGIMNPDFIALQDDTDVQAAIEVIRSNRDVDMAFYLYVVNAHQQLVGVLSLRKLVLVKPDSVLRDIMEPSVVSVRLDTDQEDVSRVVARYNLLAVPVVDENNVMRGIVTVDDVIDVIREEATEDILKMAGAGELLSDTESVTNSARVRFPWLLVAFLGELVGILLLKPFIGPLEQHTYLALFMPIIMAMGGNIGIQSATVIVRGLATGHVNRKKVLAVYWRELQVAVALGTVYGLFIGITTYLFSDTEYSLGYAAAVSVSMLVAMVIAVTVGTLLPLLLERIKVDPAVSTGPFVTSAVDVLGLLCYFLIADALIG